jgi:protein SCO1/2
MIGKKHKEHADFVAPPVTTRCTVETERSRKFKDLVLNSIVDLISGEVFGLFFFCVGLLCTILFTSVGAAAEESVGHVKVGIEEKLGKRIPLDLVFMDENGNPTTLGQVVDGKPLIIDMAYFNCPGICDNVLASLADVLDAVDATPGSDFKVATISFDPSDNPRTASAKKEQYWGLLKRPFPSDDWKFLTGDSATIYRLTNAMGFYFSRDKYQKFTHPTALIIVDKSGKIVRYIQGTNFAPVDLKMALMEAKSGTPEQIISSILCVCFSHDPSSDKLVFNVLQVVGVGTLVFLVGFIVFLRSTKNIGKPKEQRS